MSCEGPDNELAALGESLMEPGDEVRSPRQEVRLGRVSDEKPWSLRPAPSARTIASSRSACPRVLGVLADCQLVPATGRSIEARDPGLQAHLFRARACQHLRMQMSPYPRTRQSVPVTCL